MEDGVLTLKTINMTLFYKGDKTGVTKDDLKRTLEKLKIYEADYLYIHTGMSFGVPNHKLSRRQILEEIFSVFADFGIKNILLPTFTFSFCNGNHYNLKESRSKMGALNEYIRMLPNAVRSVDPLMSSVLIGEDLDLVKNISKSSIGKGSTFDKLHQRENVKFLFFGTKVGDCFTYMHYIEKLMKVNYRYDKKFEGLIIDGEDSYRDTYELFVRYSDIYPGKASYLYEQMMIDKGISRRLFLGDSSITIVDEPDAFDLYVDLITKDPNYFLDPISKFTFDKTFHAENMVAL